MEILQNLWSVLVTEDENLTKYVSLSLTFIEIYVSLKLFTTILNIDYTKEQKNKYIIFMSFFIIISNVFLPSYINIFLTLILWPIIIKYIFKISFIKTILVVIIPMIVTVLLESIYLKLCFILFNITPEQCKNIIIYRIPFMLIIYFTMFLLATFIGVIKINFSLFENLSKRHKRLIIVNLLFILICIATQFYLLLFYNKTLPLYITLISLFTLLTYSIISIYSLIKTLLLEMTKTDLEKTQLHNKTLEVLYNNTSAFKHDFNNILTAFGGFISTKNIEGLTNYYNKILDECHINNNLSTLNPSVINNEAIYNILATKYYKADELGIDIQLHIFIDLNTLKLDTYEFSRILAILLDNAIEAASICSEKTIIIDIHDFKKQKCQILTIQNTYSNKDIDISKLSTKGYTSKSQDSNEHGIGLWQVSKMVKKHNNLILETNKDDKFFKQELTIYY